MKESCQAKDWYPLFREVYEERTWEEWEYQFCNELSNQYLRCCFYKGKVFFNPSKRVSIMSFSCNPSQSERLRKTKEAIRILEGKE
jgi:hypothetical protein